MLRRKFSLKIIVILLDLLVSFISNRPFGSIIHDIAIKYEEINVGDLRKLEKLTLKQKKAELDITFLKNCQNFQLFIVNTDLHQTEVAVHRKAPEGLGGGALLDQAPQGGAGVSRELLR